MPDIPTSPPEPLRLALTPAEAARALGIGVRLLWSETNQGRIPHLRVGRRVLYPIAELEEWLAERARAESSGR